MKPEMKTRIIGSIKIYCTGSISMLVVLLLYGTDLLLAVRYLVISTIGGIAFLLLLFTYIYLVEKIKEFFRKRRSKEGKSI